MPDVLYVQTNSGKEHLEINLGHGSAQFVAVLVGLKLFNLFYFEAWRSDGFTGVLADIYVIRIVKCGSGGFRAVKQS